MSPRNSSPLSLALLALLTSAVVVMSRGNDYFSLWDSMVGLIIVLVAAAYRQEISTDPIYYRLAFSLIVGAGLLFIVGPFVESAIYYADPVINYNGPLLLTPDKLEYDLVFVGIWAFFAVLVFIILPHLKDLEDDE
jgi:hypothetical protein